MLATKLKGQDRAPTTKENGNIIFNFSILLVFPCHRLFKVFHESLQVHKTTCMCYLILLRSICIPWEKENEGIRAPTFLKGLFGDSLHGVDREGSGHKFIKLLL